MLAVLGTDGDMPRDWLRAGQALERLLLVAARAGFQASYLRPKLAQLLSKQGAPQIVMRLGTPTAELPQTPRRALADVMEAS